MSILAGVLRMKKLGAFYRENAIRVADEIAAAGRSSLVKHLTAIYYMNNGDPLLARADLLESTHQAHLSNDVVMLETAVFLNALTYGVTGEYPMGLQLLDEAFESAKKVRDNWRQVAVLVYSAHYDYLMGKETEALGKVDHMLILQEGQTPSYPMSVDLWAVAALVKLHFNDLDGAYEAAETAYRNAVDGGEGSMGIFSADLLLDVYLGLHKRNYDRVTTGMMNEHIKVIMKDAKIGAAQAHKPILSWMQGLVALWNKKPEQAYKLWRQGAVEAPAVTNPINEGRCYLALAENLPASDPERTVYAKRAHEVFSRIGAQHYADLAKALL
jgi:hypothetical protein